MIVLNDGRPIYKQVVSGVICTIKLFLVCILGFMALCVAWFVIWFISVTPFRDMLIFLFMAAPTVAVFVGFVLLEIWSRSP